MAPAAVREKLFVSRPRSTATGRSRDGRVSAAPSRPRRILREADGGAGFRRDGGTLDRNLRPNRDCSLRNFARRAVIEGDGLRWINQIHRAIRGRWRARRGRRPANLQCADDTRDDARLLRVVQEFLGRRCRLRPSIPCANGPHQQARFHANCAPRAGGDLSTSGGIAAIIPMRKYSIDLGIYSLRFGHVKVDKDVQDFLKAARPVAGRFP